MTFSIAWIVVWRQGWLAAWTSGEHALSGAKASISLFYLAAVVLYALHLSAYNLLKGSARMTAHGFLVASLVWLLGCPAQPGAGSRTRLQRICESLDLEEHDAKQAANVLANAGAAATASAGCRGRDGSGDSSGGPAAAPRRASI